MCSELAVTTAEVMGLLSPFLWQRPHPSSLCLLCLCSSEGCSGYREHASGEEKI